MVPVHRREGKTSLCMRKYEGIETYKTRRWTLRKGVEEFPYTILGRRIASEDVASEGSEESVSPGEDWQERSDTVRQGVDISCWRWSEENVPSFRFHYRTEYRHPFYIRSSSPLVNSSSNSTRPFSSPVLHQNFYIHEKSVSYRFLTGTPYER